MCLAARWACIAVHSRWFLNFTFMTTTRLQITGMHCVSCKTLIEDVAKDVSGVQSCIVDADTGRTIVTHDENMDISELIKEIEQLGDYRVQTL